jgi:undecaprenyl-diphosphatase
MLVLGLLVATGLVVAIAGRTALARWPALDPADPAGAVRAVGHEVEREVRSGFVNQRLDPRAATGLALTLSVAVVALGGAVLAVLALAVRSSRTSLRIDRGATNWAGTNATDLSTAVLKAITQLGSSVVVIALSIALVVLVVTTTSVARRRATIMTGAYLLTVVAGQNVVSNLVKLAVDRARPTFHPLAGFSGPSFPSGHTTAAFACFCAFAVVVGRGRGRAIQTNVLAGALGLAAMVGASRVLLGVHWLTDVIAGAALGLAWFTLATIAFGGRLLRFGAPVVAGERAAALAELVQDHAAEPGRGHAVPSVQSDAARPASSASDATRS